jgi:hypothetical protein
LINNSTLKQNVLKELHSSPIAGHFGFHKTSEIAKCSFLWEGMKTNIQEFVAAYDTCQRHKGETYTRGIETIIDANTDMD